MTSLAPPPVFTIQKGKVYRIYEKLDNSTPNGLKEIRRSKMVANTIEPARCLYIGDPATGHYDTGLDKTSRDFRGMEEPAIKKILAERKDLKEFYDNRLASYLKRNPTLTESDFLASEQGGVDLHHGQIIDTNNLDSYLKLYLAYRGGQITPATDKSNPKYNSSVYVIAPLDSQDDTSMNTFDKEAKVITWYTNKKDGNLEEVIKTLQYAGAINYTRTATAAVVAQTIKNWIRDIGNLDNLVNIIDKVPLEEIYIKTKINQLITKRVITKEGNEYYYKNVLLGKTVSQIYQFLMDVKNDSVLDQISNEK